MPTTREIFLVSTLPRSSVQSDLRPAMLMESTATRNRYSQTQQPRTRQYHRNHEEGGRSTESRNQ